MYNTFMSFLRVYPSQMLLWMALPKFLILTNTYCQNTWSFKCLFHPNVIYFLCCVLIICKNNLSEKLKKNAFVSCGP